MLGFATHFQFYLGLIPPIIHRACRGLLVESCVVDYLVMRRWSHEMTAVQRTGIPRLHAEVVSSHHRVERFGTNTRLFKPAAVLASPLCGSKQGSGR